MSLVESYDYIIVGAGIVGLSIARELLLQGSSRVLVLEKESSVGMHASGRNSGVVHAGIYYATDSLKARFCAIGAKRMVEYCEQKQLPILKCGKVIVASKPENVRTLQTLLTRAQANGVEAKKISLKELAEIEPEAKSHSYAIWSPNTAVIDSKLVLQTLLTEVQQLGATVKFNEGITKVNTLRSSVSSPVNDYKFGKLINAAGAHADQLAHKFGVGKRYRILPFKGLYWKSTEEYAKRIRTLIYPAPDINMPFLGVHITRTLEGKVLFGPTAIPAFGRENYKLLEGLNFNDTAKIGWNLTKMMVTNPGGFRQYALQEMARYFPKNFYEEAKTLVKDLNPQDIAEFYKVGIRAQLMDLEKGRLEMDFVIEKGPHSLHVLNAISPAFTCAFAFSSYVVNESLS